MEPQAHSTDSIAKPQHPAGLRLVGLLALLIVVAFVMGGGGVRYGLSNLAVQLVALAMLGFHRSAFLEFWRSAPIALKLLVAASILLPTLQLIPIPASIWSALPGREMVSQSRELIGATGWAPLSVDPARTLVALSGLIVPLTIISLGWSAPKRHLLSIGWLLVLLGLVTFVIGIPQVLSGGEALRFYEERSPASLLTGLFANRNSTGLFLVSALAMAALLPLPLARPHPAALPVRLGICALLVMGVVLTQSRTALVLCAIPALLGALRALSFWRHTRAGNGQTKPNRFALTVVGILALGAIGLGGLLSASPGRLGDTLERFDNIGEARSYIWDDATYSAQRYWPFGSGMGTFDEVFQADESLENLTERRAGRAHNDYIELAIESGFAGLALAAMWLVLMAWLSWKARASQFRWAAWASSAILLAIALQSVTDYPLRNQTMLAVGAFAILLLAKIAHADRGERKA